MVLDAITQVQLFVNVFISIYVLLILLVIIASWIRVPYALNPALRFLHDVCDPYLRLLRRILPPVGPLDLSPMVGIILLIVLDQILESLLGRLH